MNELWFSQLLQVLQVLVTGIGGVAIVWVTLHMKRTTDKTYRAVNSTHGAALASKAAALRALAHDHPSPGNQAAADAAEEDSRRHDATQDVIDKQ